MSVQIIFKMPTVAVQREVRSIVIKHGQLDHMRRLAVKRMLGISIHDPAYDAETNGMSAELDSKIRKKLKVRKFDSSKQAELLRLAKKQDTLLAFATSSCIACGLANIESPDATRREAKARVGSTNHGLEAVRRRY
jgi:hypothetical protein